MSGSIIALAAGAGALLFFLTWFAAFHIGTVKRADQSIFGCFATLHHGAYAAANAVARLCDPRRYAIVAALPVLIALVRRRPLVAGAAVALLLGANVTAQLVKPLFAHSRTAIVLGGVSPSASSWPSGHAAAAMSLGLAWVLAAPAQLRPLIAVLGAGFAVAVSYAVLTLRWHYASDVFGGFLIAGVWALLVAGLMFASDGEPSSQRMAAGPESLRAAVTRGVVALLSALALLALLALSRPHAKLVHALAHAAFTIGAASIAALAMALTTGVVLLLRR